MLRLSCGLKSANRNNYFNNDHPDFFKPLFHKIQTVSVIVLSNGRLIPLGVSVGLNETERFPDTVGTTRLCTGGEVSTWRMERQIDYESDPRQGTKEAPLTWSG